MKRLFFMMVMAVMAAAPMWAQSKVKRPETFNYQRAMESYANRNYDEAMSYFQKEIQENSKNGYAYSWMANICLSKEEYGKGLSLANKSIQYLPSKDKEFVCAAYGVRANLYLAMTDTLKAISDMDAALKIDPKCEDMIEKRADTYWSMGNYEQSNADYIQLISINETNAMGHMGYGRNLMEQKKWSEAAEQFSYVTKMYSDYASGFSFLAQCQIGEKNWKDAVDNIIKALAIDQDRKAFFLMQNDDTTFSTLMIAKLKVQQNKEPGESSWPYDIAIVYENQKKYIKAIEMYQKAYELDPASVIAERISNCYSSIGAQDKALEYIDLAYSLDSTDYDLVSEKADILYYSGDIKGAISQLDKYVEQYPDFYGGYYRRGFYKDNAGMVDDAIEDYTMAVTLDSTYYYAYLGRADQYIKKGMTEEAIRDYRMVTKLDTIPSTNSCAFYAFLALGENNKSIEYIDSCLNKFPEDNGTYYDACCLYSRMGETEKAISYLKKAFEKGFRSFSHLEVDDDIDAIRNISEYKSLVQEYKDKFASEVEGLSIDVHTTSSVAEDSTEIPFTKDYGNTCTVKCSINELPLNFVFDTGASDVSLSQVEATFMMKNGYLTKQDVIGKQYYSDANGNINEGTVINLKHVNFGGIELTNVKASVVKNQKAPLLLGQSVFQKLGKIEIDNEKKVLKVTRKIK